MSLRLAVTGLAGVLGVVGAGLGLAACGSDGPRTFDKAEFCGIAKSIERKYPEGLDLIPSRAREATPDFKRLRAAAPEELREDADVYTEFLEANGVSDSTALEKLAPKIEPAVEHVNGYLHDECGVGADTTTSSGVAEPTTPPVVGETTLPPDTTLAPVSPPSS